jgi:NADH dehydrogenase FAD-containing subunit
LLTFVVAGGGFAGVETVAGINDFVRRALRSYPICLKTRCESCLSIPDQ